MWIQFLEEPLRFPTCAPSDVWLLGARPLYRLGTNPLRGRPPSAPPGQIGRVGLLQIPVWLEGQVQKDVGVIGISLVWRRRNGSADGGGVPDGKNGPPPEPAWRGS